MLADILKKIEEFKEYVKKLNSGVKENVSNANEMNDQCQELIDMIREKLPPNVQGKLEDLGSNLKNNKQKSQGLNNSVREIMDEVSKLSSKVKTQAKAGKVEHKKSPAIMMNTQVSKKKSMKNSKIVI